MTVISPVMTGKHRPADIFTATTPPHGVESWSPTPDDTFERDFVNTLRRMIQYPQALQTVETAWGMPFAGRVDEVKHVQEALGIIERTLDTSGKPSATLTTKHGSSINIVKDVAKGCVHINDITGLPTEVNALPAISFHTTPKLFVVAPQKDGQAALYQLPSYLKRFALTMAYALDYAWGKPHWQFKMSWPIASRVHSPFSENLSKQYANIQDVQWVFRRMLALVLLHGPNDLEEHYPTELWKQHQPIANFIKNTVLPKLGDKKSIEY